ncbi:hypothetical protein GCM10023353_25550 [Tomitella cavernea]|uniref:Secreted protein n=1 Tax=Tomitella cavernea TaxID=1387982 RepID=A0ABP9CYQ8_9ACTN
MLAAVPGAASSPASNGEYPSTICRYWVPKNSTPASPNTDSRFVRIAVENTGLRNRRTSIIGSAARRCRDTNAHPHRTPATTRAPVRALSPCDAASFSA